MKKIILMLGIVMILIIGGCTSSYQDCTEDCKSVKGFTLGCAINTECKLPELDQVKEECYNECKPK